MSVIKLYNFRAKKLSDPLRALSELVARTRRSRRNTRMTDSRFDVIVIGAGIVGLGVALEITRQRLLVLEKEGRIARHQSGHNSGVIHSAKRNGFSTVSRTTTIR